MTKDNSTLLNDCLARWRGLNLLLDVTPRDQAQNFAILDTTAALLTRLDALSLRDHDRYYEIILEERIADWYRRRAS